MASMNWLFLTILAIVSRGIFGIAVKLLSDKVKVSAQSRAVLLTTGAGFLSLIISPLIGGIHFGGLSAVWGIALLMVISQAFGNIIFFKGLEKLDASTAQIAFASILLWSTLLSVLFLHSHFTLKQFLGIVILFIAILAVQYSRTSDRKLNEGIFYVVLSTALFAIFQTTSAELAKTVSAGAYLLLAFLGSSVIVSSIYWKKVKSDFSFVRKHAYDSLGTSLFACGMSTLYFVFSYFAYKHAPDRGVVVVLLTSQVVVTVILAIIFLKERKNVGRKLIGGVLAVVAGVLIKS